MKRLPRPAGLLVIAALVSAAPAYAAAAIAAPAASVVTVAAPTTANAKTADLIWD
jgi:uncharacterized membrane protein